MSSEDWRKKCFQLTLTTRETRNSTQALLVAVPVTPKTQPGGVQGASDGHVHLQS